MDGGGWGWKGGRVAGVSAGDGVKGRVRVRWGRVGGVQGVGNHGARERKSQGTDGALGVWNTGEDATGARITRPPRNAHGEEERDPEKGCLEEGGPV